MSKVTVKSADQIYEGEADDLEDAVTKFLDAAEGDIGQVISVQFAHRRRLWISTVGILQKLGLWAGGESGGGDEG